MSIIQLIHAAVLALNRIQSRSVSMIHAFRFASISKQLIYREIDFFSNRISKISNQISNGITSSEQLNNFVSQLTFLSARRYGIGYAWY